LIYPESGIANEEIFINKNPFLEMMNQDYVHYIKESIPYLAIAGAAALSAYTALIGIRTHKSHLELNKKIDHMEGGNRGLQTLLRDLQSFQSNGDDINSHNIAHVMTSLIEEDLPGLSEPLAAMRSALESHEPRLIQNAKERLLAEIVNYIEDRHLARPSN